jgi:hypothetical protein
MKKEDSARAGQTIRTESMPDNRGSHKVKDAMTGGKFGGGPDNLSHSLSGGGKANVDYQKK